MVLMKWSKLLGLGLCIAAMVACEPDPKMEDAVLLPLPQEVSSAKGSFEIDGNTEVLIGFDMEGMDLSAGFLANLLKNSTGLNLQVKNQKLPSDGSIWLTLNDDFAAEGYQIEVSENQVIIQGGSPAGLFYAVQTLRMLLPNEVEKAGSYEGVSWKIPAGIIKDAPTYDYRGSMLDVSRHFFEVADVKKYIDYLAMYKYNYLHLHLSDDQGWRIEIKSWPKLTEIGGSTQVGGGKGGFYTQEDYKDIVQYAADRFITIVPEIDMPGHTNAALASYPELNCDGEAPDLYTGTEVGFSTFCTDKEVTYQFVDDVIRELVEITPGPYIHIGGDESHVTALEDYIPFIEQVQDMVTSYGKQVIGWDEIAHAALRPSATAQYWAKAENAKMAVEQGAKVLISPATRAYLDMQYDSTTRLGLHWAAYVELDSAYLWEPSELVEGINKENILGVEAPLWTETISTLDEVEYMVFPRLIAISEVAWTDAKDRNWESFKKRLKSHYKRMELMDIDFYKSPLIDSVEVKK